MYKRTIWQDRVDGVQNGTPLSAENLNNLEACAMEAGALAALVSTFCRGGSSSSKVSDTVVVEGHIEWDNATHIDIPAHAIRNNTDYFVATEVTDIHGESSVTIVISNKTVSGFDARYVGGGEPVDVRFIIMGGMD